MRKILNFLIISYVYLIGSVGMPSLAEAIVVDSADVLEGGDFSIGLDTEVLLSNPSSEGLEVRAKYGVSDNLNSQAIFGIGSDYRRMRFGVNNVLSIYPDAEGQLGVSALLGGLYLRRYSHTVFVAHAGPMIHKRFTEWAVPFNAFLAWPFAIELDSGRYFTGSQLVAGSILEFDRLLVPLELGIGLGHMETYVAAGVTFRFGDRSRGNERKSSTRAEEEKPAKRKPSSEPVVRNRHSAPVRSQPAEPPPDTNDGGYYTVD